MISCLCIIGLDSMFSTGLLCSKQSQLQKRIYFHLVVLSILLSKGNVEVKGRAVKKFTTLKALPKALINRSQKEKKNIPPLPSVLAPHPVLVPLFTNQLKKKNYSREQSHWRQCNKRSNKQARGLTSIRNAAICMNTCLRHHLIHVQDFPVSVNNPCNVAII